MNKRQLWLSIVLVAVLCLTVGVTQAQEKSYSADRFDIAMTVEEGGSVLVTETAVFDFIGGPFTFVFRELPLDHTDGISVLEASVDGVVYPVGANPGQVEISSGNPMRITWHLEATSNISHTVMLTYRAEGVVRQEEGADALYWQPLPDSYEYTIGESQTRVNYPTYTTLISEPAVLAGNGRCHPISQPSHLHRASLAAQFPVSLHDAVCARQFDFCAAHLAGRTADCRRAARRPQRPTAHLVCPGIVDFGRRTGGYVHCLPAWQFLLW